MNKKARNFLLISLCIYLILNSYSLIRKDKDYINKYDTGTLYSQKTDSEAVLVYKWNNTQKVDFLTIEKEKLQLFRQDQKDGIITILEVQF